MARGPAGRLSGIVLAGWLAASAGAWPADAVPVAPAPVDASWRDSARGRDVPVRVRVPPGASQDRPVILFSHGLGGSRDAGTHWAEHWAAHGFIVVHLQHPGSDESVWKGQGGTPQARLGTLKAAASGPQLVARSRDVAFVLDELARRQSAGDPLLARADLSRVGLAGHSFGAHTTLAAAGQRVVRPGGAEPLLLEPRIRAAIAFSPAANPRDPDPSASFGAIRIPVMSLTGTRDGDVIGNGATPAQRVVPFENMKSPGKYLAVFDGADHAVFGGMPRRRGTGEVDAHVRAATRELTLDFWRAHLGGDDEARARLEPPRARRLLTPKDRYEAKP